MLSLVRYENNLPISYYIPISDYQASIDEKKGFLCYVIGMGSMNHSSSAVILG